MRTKNISQSVINDAKAVCNSIYRMNAKTAIGYAFTKRSNGREVATGEFVFTGESITSNQFDGFINFADKTLTDLISNEQIILEATK